MMEKQNHWKTAKGKQTLYNVFRALVNISEERRRKNDRYPIRFETILLQLTWDTKTHYKKGYVFHALNELMRLGFVKMNTYAEFRITPAGWEFWKKRQQLKGARV